MHPVGNRFPGIIKEFFLHHLKPVPELLKRDEVTVYNSIEERVGKIVRSGFSYQFFTRLYPVPYSSGKVSLPLLE